MGDAEYLLDNRAAAAGRRFEVLSALFDPSTFRHLAALGVDAGWRCWELGAGGTPVVRWLAERVGPDGYVLATDIDVSWAVDAASAYVEVRRHDVERDDPPERGTFDLVHARLVLVHLRERERVLRSLVQTLRPGGWLLIEDADPALQPLSCIDEYGPAQALANSIRRGFRALLAARGADLAYGRKLPRLLRAAGLSNVAADAYFPVASPVCSALETETIAMIRDQLVEHGIATVEEIETHLANVAAGQLDLAQPPMISAWGQLQPPA
ncbi:methyltransferase domain-containing protein [bacterium]|nr:MAG: methyltransferase domain-containing protein [bacterium]